MSRVAPTTGPAAVLLPRLRSAASGGLAVLLALVDAVAALLLAADLIVVSLSVFYRYVLAAPIEWADDVARGLMVALSFFGAAGALARSENAGVAFFVQRLRPLARRRVDAVAALIVLVTAASVAWNAMALGRFTTGQTTGSGLPLELTFYPMGAGALCMTIFAFAQFCRRRLSDLAFAVGVALALAVAAYGWRFIGTGAARSAPADALRIRRLPGRRRADRLCAGIHRADLHLDRWRASGNDLRPADGAGHRQFRPPRDPVLHPRRLPDGSERHVRSSDRAASNASSDGFAAVSTS